ncbi:MAG TPA: hydroxymethylglutaryl-CoA lyase [Burkholderiales bacterium]|nr:hydroxymethylglutaryl-CoA lyase [Burkholderiales bacterium]
MQLPKRVKMVEVGPRDGLQNEPEVVPSEIKIGLIDRLSEAGFQAIEATSFVSPKWVPRMADAAQVMTGITRKPGVSYPVLVPNMKGLEAALAAGVTEIAGFAAATETFSQRNTNCSIAESFERFDPVIKAALANGLKVRGYISVALFCPYEGEVDPKAVGDIARRLYEMGCYEISFGDTTGAGTAGKTQRAIEAIARHVPIDKIGGHFHDTCGQAIANIYASMEMGVAVFDSSVGGLGGCPYSPGATGNVASEDVLYLMEGLGIETGVDMNKLLAAAQYICDFLGRPSVSRAGKALLARRKREASVAA